MKSALTPTKDSADRVERAALGRKNRLRLILPTNRGLCRSAGLTNSKPLLFKRKKTKELVMQNRTAYREAEVIVANLLLGVCKWALRPKGLVPVEVVRRAMELVRSGAKSEINRAWSTASNGSMIPAIPETPP